MSESNILESLTDEVEERLDHAAEAVKVGGKAAVTIPSDVASLAANFVSGGTDVVVDTGEQAIDAVVAKIKEGLKVLKELGGVVTGD